MKINFLKKVAGSLFFCILSSNIFADNQLSLKKDFNGDGVEEVFSILNRTNDPHSYGDKLGYVNFTLTRQGKVLAFLKRNEPYVDYEFTSPKTTILFGGKLKLVEVDYSFNGETGGTGQEYFMVMKKEIRSVFKINLTEGEGGYSCSRTVKESSTDTCLLVEESCVEDEDLGKKPDIKKARFCWDENTFSRKGFFEPDEMLHPL